MKNKLTDLNDHLFAQIERLSDEGMTNDDIEREARRAEAIVAVADRITGAADLRLKAAGLFAKHGPAILPMLPLIGAPASAPAGDNTDQGE